MGAEKCQFGFKEIAFVGHLVGKKGIRPDPLKIQPFLKYPTPKTVRQVKSFLGATGFFRKFIKINVDKNSFFVFRPHIFFIGFCTEYRPSVLGL